VDPFTYFIRNTLETSGEYYLNTMDTIADATESIPEEIRPSGKPYPGFWGEVWRNLLPLRKLLRLP
jgi:hypothetical protein